MVGFLVRAALRQNGGGERDDRAVRLGQHLVNHAVAGDGGEGRCTLPSQHNEVGQLRLAL